MPNTKNLATNKDLRKEVVKGLLNAITQQLQELGITKTFTDEDVDKIVDDESRLSNFIKAQEYLADVDARHNAMLEAKEQIGVTASSGSARVGYHYMKSGDTPEIKEHNRKMLSKLSTIKGTDETFKEMLKTAYSVDPKYLVPTSFEESYEFIKSHPETEPFWAITDFPLNGTYSMDKYLDDGFKRNTTLLQTSGVIKNYAKQASNPLALIMPELSPLEVNALMTVPKGTLSKYIDSLADQGIEGIVKKNQEKKIDGTYFPYLANTVIIANQKADCAAARKGLESDLIKGKNIFTDCKYLVNGKEVNLEKALIALGEGAVTKDKATYDENGKTKDKIIEIVDIKDEIGFENHCKISDSLTALKRKGTRIENKLKDLKAAHGRFTKKTKEFTEMIEALEKLTKINKEHKLSGSYEDMQISQRNYVNKSQEALKAVKNYLDIKAGQRQNKIRRERVGLAKEILEALDAKDILEPISSAKEAHNAAQEKMENAVINEDNRTQVNIANEELDESFIAGIDDVGVNSSFKLNEEEAEIFINEITND